MRGKVTKDEIKVRILKLKHALYNGEFQNKNGDWHDGAQEALNSVLDILDEYRI